MTTEINVPGPVDKVVVNNWPRGREAVLLGGQLGFGATFGVFWAAGIALIVGRLLEWAF